MANLTNLLQMPLFQLLKKCVEIFQSLAHNLQFLLIKAFFRNPSSPLIYENDGEDDISTTF